MNRLVRVLYVLGLVATSAVGLSCDINDYCLNCATGDGGPGDGGDGDGADAPDAPDASACTAPEPEKCDNKDNDCDGAVDEGQLPMVGDLCDNQMGACAGGVKVCTAGVIKCTKPPAAETCDNIDNDCDGTPDDGDPGGGAKCGTDSGECVAGTLHCQTGSIQCIGAIGGTTAPFGTPETCDGKDNNCDGMIDNGAPVPATACDANNDVGLCDKGTPTCIGGSVICVGQVGPSPELCDNMDQDCDGNNTNSFNLMTDPTNCGSCGNACNLTNAVEGCANGQCTVAACEAGYHDNNNTASDGCEFGPCTTQGNEVCNNADDDCDGLTDGQDPDMVVPLPASMCRTTGECTGATVVCDGVAGGFKCDYPDPDVQETNGVIQQETLCDGKDNDCDGAIDEGQPGLGQACTRGLGECATTGILICDPNNLNGAALCDAPPPGTGTTEVCDGKDNNCDGTIDNGAATGNLAGQEWVTLPGSTVQMMKYEASRPDATGTDVGSQTTHACSRLGAQPWTNITYPQAVAVCSSMGARLCTEAEWQTTCLPDVTYPLPASTLTTNVDDFVFVEAENALTNATIGGRTWAAIAPATFNGVTAMQVPDTGFSVLTAGNALAQSPRLDYQVTLAASTSYRVWLRLRSPASGSRSVWVGLTGGTTPGGANATAVTTASDNQWQWVVSPALTSAADGGTHTFSVFLREDGVMVDTIAFARQGTKSPTFENVWAYETNPRTAQPQVCNGDEVDTAPPVAIAASPNGATAVGTTATFTTVTPHRVAVGTTVTVAGVANAAYNGTWTVVTTPTPTKFTAVIATSGPAASGGGTANGDQDDNLATGWSAACHAEHGVNDAFDMSGNAKEWTLARVAGQNPLRGGSANNAVNGLTCKLNFTLADNTFFFPNVGFRCCRP